MKQSILAEDHIDVVNRYLDKGMTGAAISKALGVSLSCFNKWKRKNSDRIGKKQRLKKPLPVVSDEILKLILELVAIKSSKHGEIKRVTDRYMFADTYEIQSEMILGCMQAYNQKWSDKSRLIKFFNTKMKWILLDHIKKAEQLEFKYRELEYIVSQYEEDVFRIFNPSRHLPEESLEYLFEIL